VDRRLFLKGASLAAVGLGFAPRLLAAAEGAVSGKTLVFILMRGAADGLSLCPPLQESRYAGARPTIHLPASGEGAALKLDGAFGLHPALAALKPFYDDGTLAAIHQVGSPDPTRSHFDAQDFLESGTPGVKRTEDGFLARAVRRLEGPSPLKAVALQPSLPRVLMGGDAVAMGSLAEFRLQGTAPGAGFEGMYRQALDQSLRGTGQEAFEALKVIRQKDPRSLTPGATYPTGPLGKRLLEIAQLIKADVGLRVAVTDVGGWDTHVGQGNAKGLLANRLQDFGDALGAFLQDLGSRRDQVLVIALTEFGRTVKENGNRGTDHGHGGLALVAGGSLRGGRVLAPGWRSLREEHLHEGRDVPMTTDFRDLLGEALTRHLGLRDLQDIFPGHPNDPRKWPGLWKG
jgi:uncharacterized protein (DUF1501 family)